MRVVPDVAGVRKAFDYLVPDALDAEVRVGTSVRVTLHNRRVAGWVVADGVATPPGVELRPVDAVRGWGPPASVVAAAEWAAWRWAGPPARLLGTASAPTLTRTLPPPGRLPAAAEAPPDDDAVTGLFGPVDAAGAGRPVVLCSGPADSQWPVVAAAAACLAEALTGPGAGAADAPGEAPGVLVLAPAHSTAERVAARLRRAGHDVALLPGQWAAARAGGRVVVGTRAAALAPLARLVAAVVLDAHDEAYQEERAPTWRAWEVVAERARRDGAPCVLVSSVPSVELLAAGELRARSPRRARARWPTVEVVDRRGDDPRTGLYSERLVSLVRWAAAGDDRRVLCVLNRTGRARLLSCATCGELAGCERCGSAVEQRADPAPVLHCRRCGAERPVVCRRCGATRLKALRLGVSRVREELEALAGTPVAEVVAAGPGRPDRSGPDEAAARVVVGTEAVLHRLERADAVAFLDLDGELLAPRFAAAEQALALVARAARIVARATGDTPPAVPGGGAGRAPGLVVLQTRQPHHAAVRAAAAGDPGILAEEEAAMRAELGLPPARALALVSGEAADTYGAALRAAAGLGVEVTGPVDGVWSVRAPDHEALADLLAAVPRPTGRLRVAVDPARA